ncbi:MAG: sulfatase [Deltaproteobacteria bacterium]|nr:sulfatase [Deltaproteobacteria bacterium]
MRLAAGLSLTVAAACALVPDSAVGREIIHDIEQKILVDQHGDEWRAEDRRIDTILAELESRSGKRPNIIHIMWDDTSLGEVGIPELNKVLGYDTPNLNEMADEGIAFTRMYTEPSCTPTRTAALTGRLAVRAGMYKVAFPPEGLGLAKQEVTIAEILSKSGYTTGFVGKGHQGDIEESYLHNQGFDYANFSMYNQFPFMMWNMPAAVATRVKGFMPFQWDKKHTLDREFRPLGYINQLEATKGGEAREFLGRPGPKQYKQLMRAHQNRVLEFIDEHAGGEAPFYLAYWPHMADPMVPPEQLTSNASTWWAYSMEQLDRDIGEVLAKLEEAGLAENTLVIAMADNGPMHELAPEGPHEVIFAGYKGDHREGAVRVPAFAWWPGVIEEGQVVNDMITVHDLFTTFARLGGGLRYVPRDRVIDGVDQTALLLFGEGSSRRDYYHIYTGDRLAASMKQQLKRDWTDDRPGLVSDAFVDLYRDVREEYAEMPPYIWAWPAFDQMRERHEAQMKKYPNREVRVGKPYEGIADLREDAARIADRLVEYNDRRN